MLWGYVTPLNCTANIASRNDPSQESTSYGGRVELDRKRTYRSNISEASTSRVSLRSQTIWPFLEKSETISLPVDNEHALYGDNHQKLGFDWDDWRAGYSSQQHEHSYWIDEVEGSIPKELFGTYFRNGPGLFDIGEDRVGHPFDGDGLITSIAFKDGKAFLRSRFVRTEGFEIERESHKIMFRNAFGTQPAGGALKNLLDVKQKNVANTAVLHWGGKLLALWDCMQPYALDPSTLQTLGVDRLGGLLRPGLPISLGSNILDAPLRAMGLDIGGDTFAAHPRVHPTTGTLHTFSYQLIPSTESHDHLKTVVTFWELDEKFRVLNCTQHTMQGYAFLHDFCFTDNYYVIFKNPVDLDLVPFLVGEKCPAQCIEFKNERPTELHILPRGGRCLTEGPRVAQLPACFVFHHANAFEDTNGDVVIDSVRLPGMLDWGFAEKGKDFLTVDEENLPHITLWRSRVSLDGGGGKQAGSTRERAGRQAVVQEVQSTELSQRVSEFPSINAEYQGEKHRYIYMCASAHPTRSQPFQCFTKLDMESGEEKVWSGGPRYFCGEPEFIPFAEGKTIHEDDGWIIGFAFNAASGLSELIILDARNMTTVAKLKLKHHIPYALHGQFVTEYYGP